MSKQLIITYVNKYKLVGNDSIELYTNDQYQRTFSKEMFDKDILEEFLNEPEDDFYLIEFGSKGEYQKADLVRYLIYNVPEDKPLLSPDDEVLKMELAKKLAKYNNEIENIINDETISDEILEGVIFEVIKKQSADLLKYIRFMKKLI